MRRLATKAMGTFGRQRLASPSEIALRYPFFAGP
jgi:hypothetical protein